MNLSIIIVAFNVKDLVYRCLKHVQESGDCLKKEVLYVDNGSSDGTIGMIQEHFPETVVIESKTNLGFIRANNLAYEKAGGKYVLMLNSDAFIGKETLQKTFDFMETHPNCGALGGRLVGEDGVLQPSARYFGTPWRNFVTLMGWENKLFFKGVDDMSWDHSSIRECDWVPGCYLLARKSVIDQTGFFLRQDFFMYNDDNDLCLRIKKRGYKVCYFPENIIHLGGANNKRIAPVSTVGGQIVKLQIESRYIFLRKNYGVLCVLTEFFFILVFNFLRIIKRVFFKKGDESPATIFQHIQLAYQIMLKTEFGNKAIH